MTGQTVLARTLLLMAPSWCKERSDTSVIARARRGDPSAFDELVHRHQSRIYNLAYRMLRQPEDAEDVTQEAFLKAFEALPRLKDDAAFGAWLCRIAANMCLMRLRSPSRRVELSLDVAFADAQHAKHSSNPEIIGWAREAIAKLPPKYRLAVVAFYLEGHSYEEGARLAGVPVLTFKTHLYRARKLLRALLGELAIEDGESAP